MIASAFSRRAQERAANRAPTRSFRDTYSPQPPTGAILHYRMLMRGVMAAFRREAEKVIESEPDIRTDALDDIGDRVEIATAAIHSAIDGGLSSVAGKTESKSKSEFHRLGINLRTAEPPLGGLIDTWRAAQIGKIRSLVKSEAQNLGRMLRENEGAHPTALRQKIQERFSVSRSKAELLARDQILTLNAKVTQARMTAAGVTEYIWTTSGDERVRGAHKDLDGKRFRFDAPPVIASDGRTGNPGDDYQCRCTAFPILPSLGEAPAPKPKPKPKPSRKRRAPAKLPDTSDLRGAKDFSLLNELQEVERSLREFFGHVNVPQLRKLAGTRHVNGAKVELSLARGKPRIEMSSNEAEVSRLFSKGEKGELQVYHAIMEIKESSQGKGLGAKILRDQLREYEVLGVKKINLYAVDVGRYTWARMGFSLKNPGELAEILQQFESYLVHHGLSPSAARATVSNIKSVRDLARVEIDGERTGKAFMLSDSYSSREMTLDVDMANGDYKQVVKYLDERNG